jgi:RNA polymerase sigma-70 factor (family 1)
MPNYNDLSDSVLLSLMRNGDRAAFTAIYHRYGRSLTEFAASSFRLKELDDAGDVLHDLFVWIWTERQNFVIKGELKNYLFTAMKNRVIDYIRKNRTREQYANLVEELIYDFEEHLAAKQLAQVIESSIDGLPPRVAQIYRLSRHEHLNINEIAQRLDLSEQTVKNQLTTALKRLRKSIPILLALLIGL